MVPRPLSSVVALPALEVSSAPARKGPFEVQTIASTSAVASATPPSLPASVLPASAVPESAGPATVPASAPEDSGGRTGTGAFLVPQLHAFASRATDERSTSSGRNRPGFMAPGQS